MLVDFNSLPDTSRLWIYQSDRALTTNEINQISDKLEAFVSNWKRHGDDLKASYQLKYNQFIIIAVDEKYTDVSGCSIDASVHLIKEIEKEFTIDLFNKMNISFKHGEHINTVSLKDFKTYADQKKITNQTIVFNNTITTKADLETAWQIKAGQSWHARYI